jgi:ABC-type polysaccharide/polyol phosphate transport system ATPase subunit
VIGSVGLADVGKSFRRRGRLGRLYSLKGALFYGQLLRGAAAAEEFSALRGVCLHIAPGEAVALVGPNGSGKSTLLKLIGGILRPTLGTVTVEGRVTALIELGAGFHPEITGRENVIINGMLLGLSRAEVEDRLDDILAFADIGDFIDQPVKTYSSGMYLRLGFAVAVAVDPDVLLIDEILAVGDAQFERRCMDRLARMRRRGVTMVIVSHDLDLVSSFTDRALYLRRGAVVATGPSDAVVARYRSDVAGDSAADEPRTAGVRVIEEGRRWGTGDVEIVAVEVTSGGRPLAVIPSGADCTITIRYRVHRPVDDFVFGLAWHGADGSLVAGHNTEIDGLQPDRLEHDGEVSCRYPSVALAAGEYQLDAAVHAADGLAYDYWCQAATVRVTAPVPWTGVWAPAHSWGSSGPGWR